ASGVRTDLVAAIGHDGDGADSLRLVERLSVRRAELAFRVRDAEAYQMELPESAWKEQRKGLFDATANYLISLPIFFDVASYFPRLVGLAVASRDYTATTQLLLRIEKLVGWIKRDTEITLAGYEGFELDQDEIVLRWAQKLVRDLKNVVMAALSKAHRSDSKRLDGLFGLLRALTDRVPCPTALEAIDLSKRLFERDLGRTAFRFSYFPYVAQIQ